MTTSASPLARLDRNGLKAPFAALHHVALITNDMAKTVAFYRDVLGSEMAMSHRMPRDANERHYFITVAPNVVFAFFEFPDAEVPEYQPPMIHKTGRAFDHVAFLVPDEAAFTAMYTRLHGAGGQPERDPGPRPRPRLFLFRSERHRAGSDGRKGRRVRLPTPRRPRPRVLATSRSRLQHAFLPPSALPRWRLLCPRLPVAHRSGECACYTSRSPGMIAACAPDNER